jgi:hypothetical protein
MEKEKLFQNRKQVGKNKQTIGIKIKTGSSRKETKIRKYKENQYEKIKYSETTQNQFANILEQELETSKCIHV